MELENKNSLLYKKHRQTDGKQSEIGLCFIGYSFLT